MNYLQRKKLAFMSIVNSVKGFVRTVLGVPPLTLPDCVDTDSIINYKIDGNSVQDGTPTPEAPVEVESVGEKTKNLLSDVVYVNQTAQHSSVIRGVCELKEGITYTVSFDTPNTNNVIYFTSYEYVNEGLKQIVLNGERHSITVTPTKDLSINGAIMSVTNTVNTFGETGLCSNCMIEEGSTATEYEPYGKYKIPVVCSGKNLLRIADIENGGSRQTISCYIDKPVTFSAVKDNLELTSPIWRVRVAYLDGTYTYICDDGYTSTNFPCTIRTKVTSDNPIIEITARADGIISGAYRNIQVEYGTEVTDYEPYQKPVTTNIYLDEPLRKVSTYADTVDFKKRIVNRAIKEKIFTGDAAEWWNVWTASATENTVGVYYRNNEELGTYTDQKIVTVVGCSNYFKTTAYSLATQDDSKVGQCCISGTSNPPYIAFKVPFTSKEAWLEWLNGKYIGNEPLKVYWVCKETTETPITLPKLPTIKGTTIYSIDTAIQPSNMEVSYYSTSKE